MRYIIFGGYGYLGSHLTERLIANNQEVVVFDNLSGQIKSDFGEEVTFINGDITVLSDFESLDTLGPFDGVFHLAAKKSVAESILNPNLYQEVNVNGTRNILSFCETKKIKKLVFTSSAAVYGESDSDFPISEDSPVIPKTPYGSSKLQAELLITDFSNSSYSSAISLRIFNIVGTSNRKYLELGGVNILPTIARMALAKETFIINGQDYGTKDGTCVRDYVNVKDVVNAHVLAMEHLNTHPQTSSHHILNVSSGQGCSIMDLILKFNEMSEIELVWKFGSARVGDPAHVVGSNFQAEKLLNWVPIVGIDESIAETLGQI
jgi:UDP-glucose 4-epimerase